ncbi:hypothetical protein ACQ4PT_037029 [Festuca glaucescens]
MAIKAKYQVRRNWMGDPCCPGTVMVWDTLTCNYTIAGPPRIRRVELSSSGLNGDISSSFANLKAVQYLNLSTNNLVGSIPDALSQLSSLTVLINEQLREAAQNKIMTSYASGNDVYTDNSLQLENRRFTYEELEMITNNFQKVLGQGGFAKVYNGFLEDGNQVAVKLLSNSSIEGVSEFLMEAQISTRIHHKNLVSLIGYCKDGDCMALVYEYMSEGTLQEHIEGV